MKIISRKTTRDTLRNGKLNIVGVNVTTSSSSGGGALSGDYLPATPNEDGTTYNVPNLFNVTQTTTEIVKDEEGNETEQEVVKKIFELTKDGLKIEGNIIATGEVSAYGKNEGEEGGTTITIVDNLESTETNAALSANQGRVLNEKIAALTEGEAATTIADLLDTSIDSVEEGQILKYNAATGKWYNTNLQASTELSNLTDVTINDVDNNHILIYNKVTEKWENQAFNLKTDDVNNHINDKNIHITAEERTNWNEAVTDKHTHENKTMLDGITSDDITNWNAAVSAKHSHSNKSVLDNITSNKVSNWDTAYTNNHTHDNKTVIDGITANDIENWNGKLDKSVWDKAFYFDTNNNLKVKVNLIGEKEISAYGSGTSTGTGAITIVDALTSTSKDAALSANQGRVLKSLIDNIDVSNINLSNYYTKAETDNLIDGIEVDLSDYYTKTETNTLLNKKSEIGHGHSVSEVTNLQTTLNSKADKEHYHTEYADKEHSHAISEITDLQDALDDKSDVGHGHAIDDITNLQSTLNSKATTTALNTHTSNTTVHITAEERTSWNAAVTDKHAHSNKDVIDNITSSKVSNWDAAYSAKHGHDNKTVIDGITASSLTNWNTAYSNNHTHSNKTVIDGITSSKVSNWDAAHTNLNDWFYKDTKGNIHSKYNFIGDGEVSAHGEGDSSGSGSGSVTIVDNLTSSSKDAALSANQGRVLKSLIDAIDINNLDLSSYYKKSEVDNMLSGYSKTTHSHTFASLTEKPTTLSGFGITDAAEKEHFHDYLPLSGGTMKGYLKFYKESDISKYNGSYVATSNTAGGAPFNYASLFNVYDNTIGTMQWAWYRSYQAPKYAIRTNDNGNWSEWQTLLTSGNYKNYSPSLTGEGASGTWDITSERAKRFPYTSLAQGSDLNTALVGGGLGRNYSSYSYNYWVNAPSSMQYGCVLELSSNGGSVLSGQLAWDVNHNSTTDATRNLYWRAADTNGFTNAQWHTIAFTDSDITGTAAKATADASGNVITSTYATKSALNTHTGNTTVHITANERTNWNAAYNNNHTHDNKTVIDGITSNNVTNWNTAYTNNHTHTNKAVLDGITSDKISNWDTVSTNWNKVFSIDTNGDLKVKVNVIGEGEISAYGSGTSTGTGAITIVDALTSTSKTAALSANQGRVLKNLIDAIDVNNLDLSSYYKKTEVDTLLGGYSKTTHSHTDYSLTSHGHTFASLSEKPTTLEGYGITNAATVGHGHSFASLTDKPTTLTGYGITDAVSYYAYSYANGCLVKTDITANNNSMITFRIVGNDYSSVGRGILTVGQFYDYADVSTNMLNVGATHYGYNFGDIKVFNYGGLVYLWFKQASSYQSYFVHVYCEGGKNRVTNIYNSAMPTSGVTKLTTITPKTIALSTHSHSQFKDDTNPQVLTLDHKNRMPYIAFAQEGTVGSYVGGSADGGTFLQTGKSDSTYSVLKLMADGTLTLYKSTVGLSNILTSGNYTDYTVTKTGSGASGTWGINITGNAATATTANDSTKFGGFELRSEAAFADGKIDAMVMYQIDATALSTSNFYPIIFAAAHKDLKVNMYSTTGNSTIAYNQNVLDFLWRGNGWNDTPQTLVVYNYNCYDDDEMTIGSLGMGNEYGTRCIWVRGGLTYYITANQKPYLKTSNYSYQSSTFTVGTNTYGGTNTKVNVVWSPQVTSAVGMMYHSGGYTGNLTGTASKATADASGNNIVNTYATKTALSTHTTDTTVHITAAERTKWNSTSSNWDKAFYFDANGNLKVKVNLIGEKEISAYGEGTSTGTGAITIVDALTSTSTTAALSANQGRVLKNLIDAIDVNNLDLSSYYKKTEVNNLLSGYLPLSGGTMKGNIVCTSGDVLQANNTSTDYSSLLMWSTTSTTLAQMYGTTYIRSGNTDLVHKKNGTDYNILDSSNYTSYAAKASHSHSYIPISAYNLTNGCLVKTDITAKQNVMITFRIEGNSYWKSNRSILTVGQFYDYADNATSMNSVGATHYGYNFGDIKVFNYNNLVYLWFKQPDLYMSFFVHVYTAASGVNRVTNIYDSAMPTSGVSKLSTITPNTVSVTGHTHTEYLPLTMTNEYTVTNSQRGIVNFKSTNATEAGIRLYHGDLNTGGLWYSPSQGIGIYSAPSDCKISVTDSGVPTFYKSGTSNTLIHSGNYTTYCAKASHSHSEYLPYTGGTLTGDLTAPKVSSNSFAWSSGKSKSLSAVGWYRFATSTVRTDATGNTYLISIGRSYNYTNNESYLIAVTLDYSGCSFTQLAGHQYSTASQLFTKIRCTRTHSGEASFDFYYNGSVSNTVYVNVLGHTEVQTPTAVSSTLNYTDEFVLGVGCKSSLGFVGDLTGNADTATSATTATTASKLSTVSKTAWGQTYWTSGGVPTTISGNMSNVGNITPTTNNTYNIGDFGNYFKTGVFNTLNCGAASNNLWLCGGNVNGQGVVIARASSLSSATEVCRFTEKGMIWASGVIGTIATTGQELQLKYNNADATSIVLNSGSFKPFISATNKLMLGRYDSLWNGLYVGADASTANNMKGVNFCDTTGYGVGKVGSSSAGMGVYTVGTLYLRGGCTKAANGAMTVSATGVTIDSNGHLVATGEVTAHSDRRLKTDIQDLEVRGELRPVKYKKDGKESIGFIAQEVQELYPELVMTDESTEEKYLSLNYAQLTAVLYAELKELKKRIAELEQRV